MTKNLDPRWLVTSELKSTGGDPSLLFEIIENIIERRDWEKLPSGGDSGDPVGSFRRLIEAKPPVGCNLPAEKLLKMLELEHRYEKQDSKWADRMKALRVNVKALLDGEMPVLAHAGRPSKDDNIIISKTQGTDPEYTLRRLKRDAPDLAEQVMRGEKSPNAAAIEAGFRPERVAIRLDDMCSAARTLAGRLNGNQLDELIAQLIDLRGMR